MRNKFRSISELFGDEEERRFVHHRFRHDATPEWVTEYEDQVNLLVDRFCHIILVRFQIYQTAYAHKKLCNKIMCTIECANSPYLDAYNNELNYYELILKYKYSTNPSLETIEKRISYDTAPTSSEVRNQLIDWFEEIHVDLDTVEDSATIQSSGPGDNNPVFDYEPGPIDT